MFNTILFFFIFIKTSVAVLIQMQSFSGNNRISNSFPSLLKEKESVPTSILLQAPVIHFENFTLYAVSPHSHSPRHHYHPYKNLPLLLSFVCIAVVDKNTHKDPRSFSSFLLSLLSDSMSLSSSQQFHYRIRSIP